MEQVRTPRRRWWKWACAAVLPAALSVVAPKPAGTKANASPAPNLAGDYVWESDGVLAAVSTNGAQLIVYICNGNPDTTLSFADWFHGPLTGTHTVMSNPGGAQLDLHLHPWVADGEVTLKNGDKYFFAAPPVTYPGDPAELLRSEETFDGVTYLAGWIVPPTADDSQAVGNSYGAGSAMSRCLEDCPGGAIISVGTGMLSSPPPLTTGDLSSLQQSVPGIGTFSMSVCSRGRCLSRAHKTGPGQRHR